MGKQKQPAKSIMRKKIFGGSKESRGNGISQRRVQKVIERREAHKNYLATHCSPPALCK
jgi:hypothetical protein